MTLGATAYLLFAASAWLLALGWLWQLVEWCRNFPQLDDLNLRTPPQRPPLPGDKPDLTVIVPACNEEASIAATLRSLLASRGLRLQILAVNDRSTDGTHAEMQAIQQEHGASRDRPAREFTENLQHSLEIIDIKDLPSGWLGKPHALAVAARRASADWILFTDADVTFAPHAAALALDYAIANRSDHLILMPDWTMATPGEAAMHGAMHALSAWRLRLWRISNPQAKDFLGVGAFNLVRRFTYEAVGGFDALPMEVLEDLRLGWKIKRAGYRQQVVLGPGLAAVRWSQGAWGVVRNLEKNLFALYRFNVAVAFVASFGLVIQILWPLAAFWLGGWARTAAVVQYAAIAGLYIASRKVTRVPPAYALLFPLAVALFLVAHLRSVALALVRGGVLWRGTLYSLKDLRAHAGGFWR